MRPFDIFDVKKALKSGEIKAVLIEKFRRKAVYLEDAQTGERIEVMELPKGEKEVP